MPPFPLSLSELNLAFWVDFPSHPHDYSRYFQLNFQKNVNCLKGTITRGGKVEKSLKQHFQKVSQISKLGPQQHNQLIFSKKKWVYTLFLHKNYENIYLATFL